MIYKVNFMSNADSRHWLHGKAHEIDARLRGYASFAELKAGAPPSSQHQTLVHGDFKAANLLFRYKIPR